MQQNAVDKIDKFFSKFPQVSFTKGKTIIHPDGQIQNVFLLKRGKVRMYAISPDGQEVTLHIFRPGSFFPIMILLSKVYGKYYFEALENVETVKAPVEKVMEFVESDNEVLLDLATRFSDAISGLSLRIESLVFEDAYNRIAGLLLYFCDKFGEKKDKKVLITIPLQHDDIASWLGLRRETVSRQFEKMHKEKIVESNKKQLLVDTDKLKEKVKHYS
ncbi:MAG: Crp/Fnr family transcriptional regulator [Candidatus Levybacteria bacterium]|nr:Crp/Fnr family transcriptional regulator [Candidatus Levybacteria bacterium]